MKIVFSSLMAFAIFSVVNASTYYVSNEGNNSWNGSQNKPWETLQYAAGQVHEGDTVRVMAGEYAGFCMGWDDEAEGTNGNPIVFKTNAGVTITSHNIHTDDGINLEGVSYIVIDGFTLTNTTGNIPRAGIRSVTNTGVVIRNNTIDGMGTWGILTGFSDNILIENNRCSNSVEQHGIYFGNSGDNPIIRGNTCFGNNGCGIHINADVNMGGDGIINNALVEGNIIYNNGVDGGSGINCDGVQNSIIRNNLLYNNHASGISLYQIDGAEPAYNNKVINNTILMPEDGRWALNITDGSSGCTVFNNIFFSNHSFRGGLVIDAASLTGFTSDYNVVIDRLSPDGDATILTLEEWQSATGQDLHSYVSTPAQVFTGSNDFHLKTGCDAIDHGTESNAPATDIEGRTRPWGEGYDIGAYEFGAPVDLTTEKEENKTTIYPNPIKDFIMIKSDEPITEIEILDLKGNVVHHQDVDNLNEVKVPVSKLGKSIYLVCVHSNNRLIVKKVVK
jgi:parallel beta-helix repeat protein